jgi:hypothetical protein
VIAFALTATLAIGALTVDEARAKAAEAIALGERGETGAARALLEEIARHGFQSADLDYARGTLALEAGDTGAAARALLRALDRDPFDDDARHNLAIARAQGSDDVAGVDSSGIDPQAIGARVPPALASWLFSILLALTLIAFVAAGAIPRARGTLDVVARALATVTVAAAAVLALRLLHEASPFAVVTVAETPARRGAAPDADVSFTAHAGLYGRVVEERDGFARLRLENGLEAYVAKEALTVVE